MLKRYATFLTLFALMIVQVSDNVIASDDEKMEKNIVSKVEGLNLSPSSHYAHASYDINAKPTDEDATRYRLLMTAIIQGRRLEDCIEDDRNRQEQSTTVVPFNSSGRVEELQLVDSLDLLERGQSTVCVFDDSQMPDEESQQRRRPNLSIVVPVINAMGRIDELDSEDLSESSGSVGKGQHAAVDINCSQMPCDGIPREARRGYFFDTYTDFENSASRSGTPNNNAMQSPSVRVLSEAELVSRSVCIGSVEGGVSSDSNLSSRSRDAFQDTCSEGTLSYSSFIDSSCVKKHQVSPELSPIPLTPSAQSEKETEL